MISFKIANDVYLGHIHELYEFALHVSRTNVRRIDLTIEMTYTSPPQGIEWHGEWLKVIVNGKEFIAHIDNWFGMDDKEVVKYISELD